MKTINEYKNRFNQLMESIMGDVKPLIMEQPTGDTPTLKITKAVFDDFGKGQNTTKGSYVVLSDGITYKFSDGSIVYAHQCSPGEYTGETLPQYCDVTIKSLSLQCNKDGCKKIGLTNRRFNPNPTGSPTKY